jgi:hypothetical protein
MLGAVALIIGGWATLVVVLVALALGSFADEIGGGDADSLKESRCIFCTTNL